MTEPIMRKVNGDGIAMQLAIWEGKGRQVLCIHGLTANCRCWDVMASSLTPENAILAIDLRGRGLSDKPSAGYSMRHHIQDILCVLDDLKQEKIVLMGHSLGAFISLAFAAHYPERTEKIILMDGGGQLTQDQWEKVTVAIKPSLDRLGQVFPSFDAYVAHMKRAPFLQPWSQAIEDYFQYESEAVEGGMRSRINPDNIIEEIQNIQQEVPSGYYPKVSCPVLILRATNGILSRDDLVLPESAVEKMVSEIPNAHSVNIDGTNHFSILFQPNEMRDKAIQDFITK
ncbi:MAG: alpha/beta hydrolase [Deltaproteobacteria bacterium]|nr:alpha/beta hydrolase [Deltaproteobacteria bacterium]